MKLICMKINMKTMYMYVNIMYIYIRYKQNIDIINKLNKRKRNTELV